jgi:2-keto-4-pentenoate hydratase/2-oxohepta-3-ene-1,7-dioic acid hydratase in catechol pathway
LRICRFDEDRLGVVEGEEIIDISDALNALPAVRWPYPPGDAVITNWTLLKPLIDELCLSGRRLPVAGVRLLSPIANPTKILGIARNRRDLAAESLDPEVVGQSRLDGDPVHFFIKANSALVGASDGVALRFPARRTDPECELGIVIGKKGTNIPLEQAVDHVFGYSIGMDMSLRGMESPSSRKSIDTYAVLGPWVVTRDEIADVSRLGNSLRINGRVVQIANTQDYAFDVAAIISQTSEFVTLYPGDVIMAGTPVAVFERVNPGDEMYVEFDKIGAMTVRARQHS